MSRITDTGELSDEDEKALGEAIAVMVDDFGPDFDEEGQPLEEGESDRIKDPSQREDREEEPDEGEPGQAEEREAEEVTAEPPARRSRTASPPSRTSTRSRGRWRWSRRRACGAPSSGSRPCAP